MKRLLIMLLVLSIACIGYAQTVRNANNSTLAKINPNGEVRNSNNSLIARICSNGDIRDSNNHLLAKLDGVTVRNSYNSVLGYSNLFGILNKFDYS